MELFEWLSVLGGGLFCGVKILKRFYGWATWVAERKKELREWRLQGVKPCGNQRDKIDRFFYGPGRLRCLVSLALDQGFDAKERISHEEAGRGGTLWELGVRPLGIFKYSGRRHCLTA